MNTLNTYNCRMQSRMDMVCQTVGEIIDYLKSNVENLEESTIFEIKVVLNEIVSNAVKHGNKNDVNKMVRLSAGITDNSYAYFIVEDEGNGFCNEEQQFCCTGIVDADDIFNVKESGRGILIVNSLCDRVKFNNKGNKVVLLKKLI